MAMAPVECGREGKVCKRPEDLPVCDARNSDEFNGVDAFFVKEVRDGAAGFETLPSGGYTPSTPKVAYQTVGVPVASEKWDEDTERLSDQGFDPISFTQMNAFIRYDSQWDMDRYGSGYMGFCNTRQFTPDGKPLLAAYRWHGPRAQGLAMFNEYDVTTHNLQMMAAAPIELSAEEMGGLVEAVKLGRGDFFCHKGECPRVEKDGSAYGTPPGVYHFTRDPTRLAALIERLEARGKDGSYALKMEGLKDERRALVLEYLKGVRESVPTGGQTAGYDIWAQRILTPLVAIALIYQVYMTREMVKAFKQTMGERARIDGSDVKFEDIVKNVLEAQLEEWKKTGTFSEPYIDTDGLVERIIDVISRPQKDQKNYLSAGVSRSGKTATTLRGLAQAWVVAKMTADERRAFFEKTTAMMGKEEARVFVGTMEANAAKVAEFIQRAEVRGFATFYLDINRLSSVSAIWANKDAKMLDEKIIMPLMKIADGGTKVVLFIDEIQMADDGSQISGRVALRDRLKALAEAHSNVTLAIATTIGELESTLARDPASLNRYVTIFHDAASPEKVGRILILKPYVRGSYGVETIEPAAMKAVYLLGLRVHPKPASLTAAESFFFDVLHAAQKAGQKHLTLDFVFQYYDERHVGKHGARGVLAAETLDGIFNYETKEVEDQNRRDRTKLEQIEREAGGAMRVRPPWWDDRARLFDESIAQAQAAGPEAPICQGPRVTEADVATMLGEMRASPAFSTIIWHVGAGAEPFVRGLLERLATVRPEAIALHLQASGYHVVGGYPVTLVTEAVASGGVGAASTSPSAEAVPNTGADAEPMADALRAEIARRILGDGQDFTNERWEEIRLLVRGALGMLGAEAFTGGNGEGGSMRISAVGLDRLVEGLRRTAGLGEAVARPAAPARPEGRERAEEDRGRREREERREGPKK